jgi:hypothetical protein
MSFVEKNDPRAKTMAETKRQYHTPVLSEYGDIRKITQTHTTGSKGDGGGKGSNKTH